MQELTPHEQEILDRYSNRGDYKKYVETTTNGFETSGLDAHIRGRLSPDENNEWVNAHTPEQIKIVERMKEALKKKPSLEQFLK